MKPRRVAAASPSVISPAGSRGFGAGSTGAGTGTGLGATGIGPRGAGGVRVTGSSTTMGGGGAVSTGTVACGGGVVVAVAVASGGGAVWVTSTMVPVSWGAAAGAVPSAMVSVAGAVTTCFSPRRNGRPARRSQAIRTMPTMISGTIHQAPFPGTVAGSGGGAGVYGTRCGAPAGGTLTTGGGGATATAVPHLGQNRASAASGAPQLVQVLMPCGTRKACPRRNG